MCLEEFGIKKRIQNPILNKPIEEILGYPAKTISIPEKSMLTYKQFIYFPRMSAVHSSNLMNRENIIKGLHIKNPIQSLTTAFETPAMKKFLIFASKKKTLKKLHVEPSHSTSLQGLLNSKIIRRTPSIETVSLNLALVSQNTALRKIKDQSFKVLKAIDLKDFDFSGALTSKNLNTLSEIISRQKDLNKLHIQSMFKGKVNEEAICRLYQSIGKAHQLKDVALALSANPPFNRPMTSKEVAAFAEMIKASPSLANLGLNLTPNFSPSDSDYDQILSGLAGHEHLKKLLLTIQKANNLKVQDGCFRSLSKCLGNQTSLEDLSLNLFNLKCENRAYIVRLFSSLADLKTLKNLSFIFDNSRTQSYNAFTSQELDLLIKSLSTVPLETLSLVLNSLDQESENSFGSFFQKLGKVETLANLSIELRSDHSWTSELYTSLFEGCSQLPKLKTLKAEIFDSSWNEIFFSVESLLAIKESLSKCKSLLDLQLFINRANEAFLEALIQGIEESKSLLMLTLDLSGSSITDEGFTSLIQNLGKIYQLRSLILGLKRCSMLSDLALMKVGELFPSLKYLKRVGIYVNVRNFLAYSMQYVIEEPMLCEYGENTQVISQKLRRAADKISRNVEIFVNDNKY